MKQQTKTHEDECIRRRSTQKTRRRRADARRRVRWSNRTNTNKKNYGAEARSAYKKARQNEGRNERRNERTSIVRIMKTKKKEPDE